MAGYLHGLAESTGWWLYMILGGLAFGEAAILLGVVLPGETALLIGGYLCYQRTLSLPIMLVVAVGCAKAVTPLVMRSVAASVHVCAARGSVAGSVTSAGIEPKPSASAWCGKAVFFGRSIALLRALVPTLAGASRMRYPTFLPWNAAGGLVWGGGCVLLGYLFGRHWTPLVRYLRISSGQPHRSGADRRCRPPGAPAAAPSP